MLMGEAGVVSLAKEIENMGAKDLIALQRSDQCDWPDYLIVGTFASSRQASAMLDEIRFAMREYDQEIRMSDRSTENTWFLCDAGEVVIHLLDAQAREFYQLELLDKGAKTIYSATKI
ncbi:MAG: ribosome silencing factor [Spirochaetia bacterium]